MTEEVTKAPALPNRFMSLAEHKRLVYRVDVPPGVPLDRILEADYWAHTAKQMAPGQILECVAVDGSYFAELLVRKIEKEAAHCWLLRSVNLNEQLELAKPPSRDDYRVEFGGAHKWRVVKGDEVVHKGEPSEADARAWLDKYLTV